MRDAAKIVAAVAAVAVLAVGGWFGYWFLARESQSARYEVNTRSQQYQAGLVARERDRVTAHDLATDPGQRQAVADAFCAEYDQLDPPTPDLTKAHLRLCPLEIEK